MIFFEEEFSFNVYNIGASILCNIELCNIINYIKVNLVGTN